MKTGDSKHIEIEDGHNFYFFDREGTLIAALDITYWHEINHRSLAVFYSDDPERGPSFYDFADAGERVYAGSPFEIPQSELPHQEKIAAQLLLLGRVFNVRK